MLILKIYLIGVVLSVLFEIWVFSMIKKGYRVGDYPAQFHLNAPWWLNMLVWFGWSLIWFVIASMTLWTYTKTFFKK